MNEYSLIQSQTLRILHFLARIFDEFFSGFRAKFQKRVTPFAFSIKLAKTISKIQDICGALAGKGGSWMSNFLTSAVRVRYSRVNPDVPLKDYMWHVWDAHVDLVRNIHSNFWNLWDSFTIIQNYSLVSLLAAGGPLAHAQREGRGGRPNSDNTNVCKWRQW